MAEGGGSGFEIAEAHLTITAAPDDASVGEATESMGSRMTKWAAGLGLGALISKGLTDNLDASNATNKLKAQLNLTQDEARNIGKLSGEVYRDNFGESLDDVNETIKSVANNFGDLGDMSNDEIKSMTESALGLSNVFGVDVEASTEAAAKMVKNGLAKNSTEAFDIITRGFQNGADRSGDFLETLNEYSPQFTKLGFSGAQSMGLMSQAIKAGARDTDGIADAFKEFSLRAIDGSTLTAQGFKDIGLNAKTTAAEIAAGGPSAEKATDRTIKALQAIKDPVKQNAAGVALFGTQWEDTLRVILPSIDLTSAATTDVAGATKEMNDTMSSTPTAKVETFKRQMEGLLMQATQLPGPLGEVGTFAASLGSGAITGAAGLVTIASSMSGVGSAVVSGVRAFGTWIAAQATTVASTIASWATIVATTVAGWITTAATAVASAATIAAAWLVAYWPVALIVAAVAALVVAIVMNWDTIKRVTVQLWTDVWNFTKDIWNTIMSGINSFIDFVVNLFLNWTIYGIVVKHWRDIYNFISSTVSSVKSTVSAALNWINSTVDRIMGVVRGTFSGAWSSVRGIFTSAGSAIRSTVSSAMTGVVNSISSRVSAVTGAAGRIKGAVTGVLSNLGSLLWDSGRSLISGFIGGIMSKLPDVGGAASSIVSKVKNFFPHSPAKEGPLSGDGYTDVSGAKLVTDFADAMVRQGPVVKTALEATLGPVSATAQSASVPVPVAAGGGATVQLNINWSSFFVPTHEELRALFSQVAPDLNEALRKYNKARNGVATT